MDPACFQPGSYVEPTLLCTPFQIWYDAKNQLVRFDMRNSVPNTVFYSPTPMTYIQDFKTGGYNSSSIIQLHPCLLFVVFGRGCQSNVCCHCSCIP